MVKSGRRFFPEPAGVEKISRRHGDALVRLGAWCLVLDALGAVEHRTIDGAGGYCCYPADED